MPQGRRKVPFSAKQKKAQLQQKRDKKRGGADGLELTSASTSRLVQGHRLHRNDHDEDDDDSSDDRQESFLATGKKSLNEQPRNRRQATQSIDPNRYRLQFHRESKEDLERRRKEAMLPIQAASEESLEVDVDDVFLPGSQLSMPRRPPWDYRMSKEQIDAQENRYFREYLTSLEASFSLDELSYFELNLETWRQLWRVLEMSDVVFIVVDIRFPALLVSPALYEHVAVDLKKDLVIVLNKIDLVPPAIVVAWKHYLSDIYPRILVALFTSFPGTERDPTRVRKKTKRGGRLRMAAEGALRIFNICEHIVGDRVDLSSWKRKIDEELTDVSDAYDEPVEGTVTVEKLDTGFKTYERFRDHVLTIGFIGQPNVGKSSLINGLVGKKVVSVSRTPGHTKYFQTIFLTNNVRLCDCPGLVFPSKVPKALQVLAGSYPIAQLQEPFSSIRFVAEHVDLPKLLKLKHPEDETREDVKSSSSCRTLPWSPLDICDAWAELRGFKTARAARNDTYRAANHLLRLTLEGHICVALRPKGYFRDKVKWELHEDVLEVCKIIARKQELAAATEEQHPSFESGDEEDEEEEEEEEENEDDDGDDESSEDAVCYSANKYAVLSDK